MTMVIRDIALRLDGTPYPSSGYAVIAQLSVRDPFLLQGDGSWRVGQQYQGYGAVCPIGPGGVWEFVAHWPSETKPDTGVILSFTLPDGAVFAGEVPEGVAGEVDLDDLVDSYGWGAGTTPVSPPITVITGPRGEPGADGQPGIQGPQGIQGIPGPSTETIDATTTTIGGVLIDVAPGSGHPIATTKPTSDALAAALAAEAAARASADTSEATARIAGDATNATAAATAQSAATAAQTTANAHQARHQPGGADALINLTAASMDAASVDGAAGTASLRTLGTGAAQAAAGNDERLSPPIAATSLPNWFRKGLSGKTVCFLGDSTFSNASTLFTELAFFQNSGEVLSGTAILNYGENGASLAAFLADAVTHGITAAIAAQAQLYVLHYGINDVRIGATTEDQLVARLLQAIALLKAGVPTADILLLTPNSLLTTDVGANGFVVPNASAQAYTTLMWNAYQRVSLLSPNVPLLDSQVLTFHKTCLALSGYMTDQMHPNAAGQVALGARIAAAIGLKDPFSLDKANQARIDNLAAPQTVYARVVEDPTFYDLIATGRFNAQGGLGTNGFLDSTWPGTRATEMAVGDLVQQGVQTPWAIPTGTSIAATGANSRLSGLGVTYPLVQTGGTINVYRPKYHGDANIALYWAQKATFPYRFRGRVVGAGNGFVDLTAFPGDIPILQQTPLATDTLILPGLSPLVLTSATFANTGANLRISKAGTDFTAYAGVIGGYVFGPAHIPRLASLQLTGINTTVLETKGVKPAINTIATSVTLTANYETVLANANGGAIAPVLPAATTGAVIHIKKTDASANAVTVTRAGADTIEGATTVVLAAQYNSVTLVADGTSTWYKRATT